MSASLKKSLMLDGIACSEAIDSSGEILDLSGLDISDLENGVGVLNYEHRGDQAEGASSNDILGAITYAKKIFGPDDCDGERQLHYWNQVQLPFLYIQAELFDGEGHPGAVAAAALIRYYHNRKLPILMRYSIEGATLERDGNVLKRAIAKRVAATIKPCNRSCISGVLSDSGSPSKKDEEKQEKDLLRELASKKFEKGEGRTVDGYERLGGYEGDTTPLINDAVDQLQDAIEGLREVNNLNKALSAGGFNVAPLSLSGGSALQAENFGREKKLKNQTMAAYRDWRGKGDLIKFLKHRLPDASEDFLNHFAKLVDDYHLKKFAELEDNLYKAVATQKAPKAAAKKAAAPAPVKKPAAKPKVAAMPTVEEHEEAAPFTVQGMPVPMAQGPVSHPYFDFEQGAVVTPRGVFHVHHAGRLHPHIAEKIKHGVIKPKPIVDDKGVEQPWTPQAAYKQALDKVRPSFLRAMREWMPLNERFVKGQTSPSEVTTGVVFGLNSPGIKVPMQEFQSSHFFDAMNHLGLKDIENKDQLQSVYDDWMSRNRTGVPQHSADYFQDMFANNPQKKKAIVASKTGQVMGFNKPEIFKRGMTDFVENHRQGIMNAIKAGGGNGNLLARNLVNVKGMAHKLAAYTALLLGAGQNVVTDTHNLRSTFGLLPQSKKGGFNSDQATHDYLTQIFSDKGGSDKMNQWKHQLREDLSRYWFESHPGVKAVLNDPELAEHFKGREEHAVGPAFWWDWSAIPHHEEALGLPAADSYNEGTDHRPYFQALQDFRKAEDSVDQDLPARLGALAAKYHEQYGEIGGLLLYFQFIVPQLLHHIQRQESPVHKMMMLADDLRKAADEMTALPALAGMPSNAMKIGGSHVVPGEVEVLAGPYKGSKMHYVGGNDTHVFVRPQTGEAGTSSLPRSSEGIGWRVNSEPQTVHLPNLVDANVHAHPLAASQAQRVLMHGIDMDAKEGIRSSDREGISQRKKVTGWYQNAAGQYGLVKPEVGDHWFGREGNAGMSMPHREVAYHNIARDFFGLGEHVPPTAMFHHPKTGEELSVQQRVPGAMHFEDVPDNHPALDQAWMNGSMDKLAVMDMVMGNHDRHQGNYMLTDKPPYIHMIDNGLAFQMHGAPTPQFLEDHQHATGSGDYFERRISPHAYKWLLGLKPEELGRQMLANGVPPETAKRGQHRLMAAQQAALANPDGVNYRHFATSINDAMRKLGGPY